MTVAATRDDLHWTDAVAIFTDLGHPRAAEVAADLNALGSPEPTHRGA